MSEAQEAQVGSLDIFDTVTLANEGIEVELPVAKTGKPSGNWIKVYGSDSDVFREIRIERSRQYAERIAAGGAEEYTAEEREDMAADTLARCTISWRGPSFVGRPFSVDAARKLYKAYPLIRETINVAVGNRANFALA